MVPQQHEEGRWQGQQQEGVQVGFGGGGGGGGGDGGLSSPAIEPPYG